jgi:hypothetical protein
MVDERTLPNGRRKDMPNGMEGYYLLDEDRLFDSRRHWTMARERTSPDGRRKTLPDSGRKKHDSRKEDVAR